MIQLRDYQRDLIDRTRAEFRRGVRRVLLQSPTGSGKSVTASAIIRGAYDKGHRCLLLAHRAEILYQLSDHATTAGVPHGFCVAGSAMPDDQVVVASIPTLARRQFKAPDFIICDEAAHAPAKTFSNVLERHPTAKVLGLTACPCRLDGKGLNASFDAMVLGPSVQSLIDAGHLARPRYWAPPGPSMKGVRRKMGDFDQVEIERRMDRKVTGDAIAEYRKHCDGKTAIAFCVSIRHAEEVATEFRMAGYTAECLHGGLGRTARDEMVERFRNGTTKILSSVDVLIEGFDLPAAVGCLVLRPTLSLSMFLQMLGRVLRPAEGKEYAEVLDFSENLDRHGSAEESREWTLDGLVKRERPATAALTRCPKCYAMTTGGVCRECGTTKPVRPREIKKRAGSLVEWSALPPEEREAAKRRQYYSLVGVAKKRRMKFPEAWARTIVERQERKRMSV